MTAHTPGPWIVTASRDQVRTPIYPVAEALCPNRFSREADARLIAAAPSLLEALRQCVEAIESIAGDLDPFEMPTPALDRARFAIAKAEEGS